MSADSDTVMKLLRFSNAQGHNRKDVKQGVREETPATWSQKIEKFVVEIIQVASFSF